MNRPSTPAVLNSPERLALLVEGAIFTYLAYLVEQGIFGRGQEALARQFHCFAYVVRETLDRIDAGLESTDSIRRKIIALRLHREALLCAMRPSCDAQRLAYDGASISARADHASIQLPHAHAAFRARHERLSSTFPKLPALFSKAACAPSLGTR